MNRLVHLPVLGCSRLGYSLLGYSIRLQSLRLHSLAPPDLESVSPLTRLGLQQLRVHSLRLQPLRLQSLVSPDLESVSPLTCSLKKRYMRPFTIPLLREIGCNTNTS